MLQRTRDPADLPLRTARDRSGWGRVPHFLSSGDKRSSQSLTTPLLRAQVEDRTTVDEQVVSEVRRVLETEGATGLRVDQLTRDDLPSLGWSGTPSHIISVGEALDRVDSGDMDYLVARSPSGHPVAKAGIDYAASPGTGTLMQLATAEELQGLGIGTHVIAVAEGRIRSRGLHIAEVGVEEINPRARALYERLGYVEVGRRPDAWEIEDEVGTVSLYRTEVVILRKELDPLL